MWSQSSRGQSMQGERRRRLCWKVCSKAERLQTGERDTSRRARMFWRKSMVLLRFDRRAVRGLWGSERWAISIA